MSFNRYEPMTNFRLGLAVYHLIIFPTIFFSEAFSAEKGSRGEEK